MAKVGLFWGSDTGRTEEAAGLVAKAIGEDQVDVYDIGDVSKDELAKYKFLILGTSTWNVGELESSWYEFFPDLDEIDFKGKTVALFGMGDQNGYPDTFQDAMATLYDKVIERGAKVVGKWSADGYDFDDSKAVQNGMFVGLALDDNNEDDLTEDRIKRWVSQIKPEFELQ